MRSAPQGVFDAHVECRYIDFMRISFLTKTKPAGWFQRSFGARRRLDRRFLKFQPIHNLELKGMKKYLIFFSVII